MGWEFGVWNVGCVYLEKVCIRADILDYLEGRKAGDL